jgi:hypothetical protein
MIKMPQQRLYYEDVDGKVVPYWYVLTFRPGEIDWDKDFYFYTPIAPFRYIERDNFNDELPYTQIYYFELFRDITERLGIDLFSIKQRMKIDPSIFRQFVVQIPDIDEVLKLLPKERKMTILLPN